TSAAVTAVKPHGQRVSVTIADDDEAEYDLVVGADGLRSTVRRLIFGDLPARYAGYMTWRFVGPLPRPPPASLELWGRGLRRGVPEWMEMWGRGLRLGLVPIGGGQLYGFAVLNRPAGAPDATEDRLARFRVAFERFGGPAPDVLPLLTSPDQLIHADIEEVI